MSIATEITRLQSAKADIKSAIEQKGVEVGDGTIDTYAEKIGEISAGGSNSLECARSLSSTFYSVIFPTNYEIKLNVPNITSLNSCFASSVNLKKITVEGNINNNLIDLHRMTFMGSKTTLEEVDFSNFNLNVSSLNQTFYDSNVLKRILGVFDLTNCTALAHSFHQCLALEEVRFKENSIFLSIEFKQSAMLSDLSIQSIIDGLADLTGGTTQTLTVHQTVYQKIIDNGWDVEITAKNWTLVKA